MGKKIIWTHNAEAELNKAFLDLLEESKSIETATRIITEIYESTTILSTSPEIYKLDTLKRIIKEILELMKNIPIGYPI